MNLYELNSHLIMLSDFRPFYEQAYKAMQRFISKSSEEDMNEGINILNDSKIQVNLCLEIARRDLRKNKKFIDLFEKKIEYKLDRKISVDFNRLRKYLLNNN